MRTWGGVVDVIDEADVIDALRKPSRRAGAGCLVLCQHLAKRPFWRLDDVDGVSVTSKKATQTGSKYVSGSAGSYHSLIQNCV